MSEEYLRPEYQPLFTQVQDFIADQLNTDVQLSALGIEFLPEHRLDIEYEIKNNLGKQGTVGIVNTLKGTYGGHNGQTNAWEIEAEIDVLENPPVRRAQMKKMGLSAGTTADILDWIQESLCAPSSPTYGKFCSVSQSLGEDRGFIVGKSIVKTFAIADISAVVSSDSHWVIPYALQTDVDALSEKVDSLSVDIDFKRDKTDLSVYTYAPWTMYSYNEEEVTPPLNFNYQKITYDDGREIYGWMSEREYSGMWQIIAQNNNVIWFNEGGTIDEQGRFTALGGDSLTISDDGLAFTLEGAIPVDIRRTTVGLVPTSDRIAKMSDLSSISLIPPYIEDANGNTISADLSCVENHPDWWQLDAGVYGTPILTQVSTDHWEYTQGDERYVIYFDPTNVWYVEYKRNYEGSWQSIATGTDDSSPITANTITVGMQGDFQATWTATRPVSYLNKLALWSDLPTKTSDLTNDSGFITSAEVPTPDKIEDLSANVIYANRTCQYMADGTPYWVITWNGNNYTLSGDSKNYASYFPSEPSAGDLGFSLSFYEWGGGEGEWYLDVQQWIDDGDYGWWDYYDGRYATEVSQDATELHYEIWVEDEPQYVKFAEWTTPSVLTNDELVLKSEFNSTIGDINSVLDTINGEVI